MTGPLILAGVILVMLAFACGCLFGACCARWWGEKPSGSTTFTQP